MSHCADNLVSRANHCFPWRSLLDVDMNATVRTLVVISLFAALCTATAVVLDQGFFAAIFAAESAFALVEATRRSR
jgi:hypothetical protein